MPGGPDLVVLSGSEVPVSAPGEWMVGALAATRDLVQAARIGSGPPLMGVSVGAHLIVASQTTNAVRPCPRIEVGLVDITTATGRVWTVGAFHYEQIVPSAIEQAGGVVEESNTAVMVQGFRLGSRVRGVQYHPEMTPEFLHRLVDADTDTITRYGGSVSDAHAGIEARAGAWTPDVFRALWETLLG